MSSLRSSLHAVPVQRCCCFGAELETKSWLRLSVHHETPVQIHMQPNPTRSVTECASSFQILSLIKHRPQSIATAELITHPKRSSSYAWGVNTSPSSVRFPSTVVHSTTVLPNLLYRPGADREKATNCPQDLPWKSWSEYSACSPQGQPKQ